MSQGIILGNTQRTETIDITLVISERTSPQGHVRTAENQALLIAQRITFDTQQAAATQGAMVVEATEFEGHVLRGGQAPMVEQLASQFEAPVTPTLGLSVIAELGTRRLEGQVAQAAQRAIALVTAAERQVERAIGGDNAIIDPVVASGGDALPRDQLAGRGLGELADIQRQAFGLQLAGIGPIIRAQRQLAIGGETPTSIPQIGQIQFEALSAQMANCTAQVAQ